jgi:hypothetical protein
MHCAGTLMIAWMGLISVPLIAAAGAAWSGRSVPRAPNQGPVGMCRSLNRFLGWRYAAVLKQTAGPVPGL